MCSVWTRESQLQKVALCVLVPLRTAIAAALSAARIPAIPEEAVDYQAWTVIDDEALDEIPSYCNLPAAIEPRSQ